MDRTHPPPQEVVSPKDPNTSYPERLRPKRKVQLIAMDVQPSAWDDPIAALRAGVPHTAWTVDDLDAAHARAVEEGGRSVWTPRDTPEPGLRIAFVADPDGNLVELLSSDEEAPPT
jgi:catechol 2,3-dioxygenase-like lactoylglutathione lyase family enzyme